MYLPPCSPSSSIFSEMLELNATRNSSKPEYFEDELSVESFNAAKTSPVFFGRYGQKLSESVCDTPHGDDGISTRSSMFPEFDSSTSHPATYGYVLLDKKPPVHKVLETPPLPDPKECSPREYLEAYMFPVLLPAIEQMLLSAKENRVFERRRTRFNACDFLTEFLYRYNPQHKGRSNVVLQDIPFVQRILAENPRPPLPLSLLLSDEEAAVIIQSFYRGYLIRRQPEVQELREYQREMRNEAVDIFLKVEDFWRKHPVEEGDEEKPGGTGR